MLTNRKERKLDLANICSVWHPGREPIERTIHTLKLFRDIINFQCIKYVLSIATSAVREANNQNDFLYEALQKTGFRFRVLSGRDEALYSYLGALQSTCIPSTLFSI